MVDVFLVLRGERDSVLRGLGVAKEFTKRGPVTISESELGIFVKVRALTELERLRNELYNVGVEVAEFFVEPSPLSFVPRSGDALLLRTIIAISQLSTGLDPTIKPERAEGDRRETQHKRS